MRCFISIDIPENIKKEIREIQERLLDFIGKKTDSQNLHLTLKFLGEISDEKVMQVQEVLKKIKLKKFESEINSIWVFSEEHVGIVWLHLTNCDKLQIEIDKSLQKIGLEPEQRFMSHLTIARVKSVKNKKLFLEKLKAIKIPKIKFAVNEFKLKSSVLKPTGSVYEGIGKYGLD